MHTIQTLGHPYKRTRFSYSGSVAEGVIIDYSGKPHVSAQFFKTILDELQGETMPGGFSSNNLTPGSFGIWIQENSRRINPVKLSARHASFIASILVHEGFIESSLRGNAIILHFPKQEL